MLLNGTAVAKLLGAIRAAPEVGLTPEACALLLLVVLRHGFVFATQSEDQICSVLSHEIAHLIQHELRHATTSCSICSTFYKWGKS